MYTNNTTCYVTSLVIAVKKNSLNPLLRIRISGLPIDIFYKDLFQKCVNRGHNTNEDRLRLSKCKAYEKPKSSTSKLPHYDLLNISSFSSEFDSSYQKQ